MKSGRLIGIFFALYPLGVIQVLGATAAIGAAGALIASPTYAKSVDKFINSAWSKYQSGDIKGAMVDYQKAIDINPRSHAAYFYRGNIKVDLNNN